MLEIVVMWEMSQVYGSKDKFLVKNTILYKYIAMDTQIVGTNGLINLH